MTGFSVSADSRNVVKQNYKFNVNDKGQYNYSSYNDDKDLAKKSIWLVAKKYDKDGIEGLSDAELDKMMNDIDKDRSNGEEQDAAKGSAIKAFLGNIFNMKAGKTPDKEPESITVGDYSNGEKNSTLWSIAADKLGDGNKWQDLVKYTNDYVEKNPELAKKYGLTKLPEDPTKLPTGAKVLFKPEEVKEETISKEEADRIALQDELENDPKMKDVKGMLWEASTDELKQLKEKGLTPDIAKALSARNDYLCALYGGDAKKVIAPETIKKIQNGTFDWKSVKPEGVFPTSSAIPGNKKTPETLDQNKVNQAVDDLYNAVDGWNTNENLMNTTLAGLNKSEIEAVKKEYEAKHGESLKDALDGDISDLAQEVIDKYLENGGKGIDNFDVKKQSDILKVALAGDVDKSTVLSVITTADAAQMAALVKEYPNLKEDLKKLDYGDAYNTMTAIIDKKVEIASNKTDKVTDAADRIYASVTGAGTEEATINNALASLSPEELTKLETVYKDKYKETLKDALDGDTSIFAKEVLDAYLKNKGKGIDGFNATDKAVELKTALNDENTDNMNSNREKVLEILTTANAEQLKAIKEMYPSLIDNLSSFCGDDGFNTLKAIIEYKLK